MRALLLTLCLFAVAACVDPAVTPAASSASSGPTQDAGGYTVVITPPTTTATQTATPAPAPGL